MKDYNELKQTIEEDLKALHRLQLSAISLNPQNDSEMDLFCRIVEGCILASNALVEKIVDEGLMEFKEDEDEGILEPRRTNNSEIFAEVEKFAFQKGEQKGWQDMQYAIGHRMMEECVHYEIIEKTTGLTAKDMIVIENMHIA
ncbi:MAG: hypothetical protein RSD88_02790 [Anaerovoracaceae bacterium]